jgi:methanogenic corrinoid protein MtbC1
MSRKRTKQTEQEKFVQKFYDDHCEDLKMREISERYQIAVDSGLDGNDILLEGFEYLDSQYKLRWEEEIAKKYKKRKSSKTKKSDILDSVESES